ncbi:MAG: hypothetical protein V3U50_05340 [Acidimicrobiia bacterium]
MPWRFRDTGNSVPLCPECGDACVAAGRPGIVERVRHFLVYGMPPPVSWSCPSGHQFGGMVAVGRPLRRNARPKVLRVPIAVVRAIRRERTMEPVPLAYLIAAGVGLVAGIGLDLSLGWRWWMVTLIAVGAVWVFFLSTAFWGPNRQGALRRVRSLLDPDGQERRELRRLADQVSSGEFQAYGVSGWVGPIRLAAWGGQVATEVTSLRLAHYDNPDAEDPAVEVEFHAGSHHSRPGVENHLWEEFTLKTMDTPQPSDSVDHCLAKAQRRLEAMRSPAPPLRTVTIDVDGSPVSFTMTSKAGTLEPSQPSPRGISSLKPRDVSPTASRSPRSPT